MTTPVAIGIDIGGTQLRAAVVAADGSLHHRTAQPTPAGDATLLVATLREVIGELSDDLPVRASFDGTREPWLSEYLDLRERLSKRSNRAMDRRQNRPLFGLAQRIGSDAFGLDLRSHPTIPDRGKISANLVEESDPLGNR